MESVFNAILENLTIPLGDFVIIDLIAATTNAFSGALLARRPSHYQHYTLLGACRSPWRRSSAAAAWRSSGRGDRAAAR